MIYVVGIGPGKKEWMTLEAIEAIKKSDTIVGYKTYIELVKELIQGKEILDNGMRHEVERCTLAIQKAKEGKIVSVISSGDSGVYGMAGLVLELIEKNDADIQVKIVPGVTTSISAAALLGAPLMHDFCHISLSDLLTPWELIIKRVKLAAQGDFVICFYNPRSISRSEHLKKACECLKEYKSGNTPVGIVKNAGRDNERVYICDIDSIDYEIVDMTSMVIVGNKSTYISGSKIITPRGYLL